MVLVLNLFGILVGTYIYPLVLAKGFFLFLLILSHIDHLPVFLLFPEHGIQIRVCTLEFMQIPVCSRG